MESDHVFLSLPHLVTSAVHYSFPFVSLEQRFRTSQQELDLGMGTDWKKQNRVEVEDHLSQSSQQWSASSGVLSLKYSRQHGGQPGAPPQCSEGTALGVTESLDY